MYSTPFLSKLLVLLTTHQTTCVITVSSLPWLQLLIYIQSSLSSQYDVYDAGLSWFSKFLKPRLKINIIYCLNISCNMASSGSFILYFNAGSSILPGWCLSRWPAHKYSTSSLFRMSYIVLRNSYWNAALLWMQHCYSKTQAFCLVDAEYIPPHARVLGSCRLPLPSWFLVVSAFALYFLAVIHCNAGSSLPT